MEHQGGSGASAPHFARSTVDHMDREAILPGFWAIYSEYERFICFSFKAFWVFS